MMALAQPHPGLLGDDLDCAERRRHVALWVGGLCGLLAISIPVAVGIGPVSIAPGTVARIVGHHAIGWPGDVSWTSAQDSIVELVRLPRVLLGAVVGAGLAVADRSYATLSGGEKQRVLIARTLAQEADHLLLDEPTNHLDIRYQHEILDLVRGLGVTTVVVLHDLNLAARYCDRLVLLDRGTVAARGPAADVLTPELLEPVYGIAVRRLQDDDAIQLIFKRSPVTAAGGPVS